MTDDPTRDPRIRAMLHERIAEHGFTAIGLPENPIAPRIYTIGLASHGWPELTMRHPDVAHANHVIQGIAQVCLQRGYGAENGERLSYYWQARTCLVPPDRFTYAHWENPGLTVLEVVEYPEA